MCVTVGAGPAQAAARGVRTHSTNDPSNDARTLAPLHRAGTGLSPVLTTVFAIACGALVANLYYSQALISVISPELGLGGGLAGLIVTVTQLGYAAGLLFLVSLADLVENRRLILLCITGMTVGLVGAATSTSAAMFLVSSLVIGVGCVAAQIIVPLAAHLSHEAHRGRTIGNVMGGLLTGIMLARPVANFIASAFGWRSVFALSAVLGIAIGIVLWFALPTRRPETGATYARILATMRDLFLEHGMLRRRAATQAAIFGCFNLFWTAVPLVLTNSFAFDQREIAFFALAGAGGALAAPFAGQLADRGKSRVASLAALVTLVVAFVAGGWAVAFRFVGVLVLAAIALDAATQTNQIVSQRAIYGIDATARGRINAIYMTSIFLAGATGSLAASLAFAAGGWLATSIVGATCGLIVLLFFVLEKNRPEAAATR
jgi:predicted MFS family arabinose efflux permease